MWKLGQREAACLPTPSRRGAAGLPAAAGRGGESRFGAERAKRGLGLAGVWRGGGGRGQTALLIPLFLPPGQGTPRHPHPLPSLDAQTQRPREISVQRECSSGREDMGHSGRAGGGGGAESGEMMLWGDKGGKGSGGGDAGGRCSLGGFKEEVEPEGGMREATQDAALSQGRRHLLESVPPAPPPTPSKAVGEGNTDSRAGLLGRIRLCCLGEHLPSLCLSFFI